MCISSYIIFYLLLPVTTIVQVAIVVYCTILIENELEWQQKIAPFYL